MTAPVRIVRGPGPRRIAAWRVQSFEALWRSMGIAEPARQCICADLTLGAWRGHGLAREWGQQLDLAEPEPIQPVLAADGADIDHYADTVGILIDNESEGDRNFMRAHALACALVAAVRERGVSHLLLAAPLGAHEWGSENLQLLKLLQDAAPHYGFQLAVLLQSDAVIPQVAGLELVPQNDAVAPSHPTVAFPVPGLADAGWAAAQYRAMDVLQLHNGKLFISPNWRDPRAGGAAPAGIGEHLQVYFVLRDGRQEVDFLQRQADLRFAEGAYGLALRILDHIAQDALAPLPAALVEAQKQNIAIALMDFLRAAQGRLPADTLPPVVKASLYQSKAWGMVMSGQAALAEQYFALARQYLDPVQHRRLYLYLLNISALNQLRLGQVEQALAFENEIERQLTELPDPDWHLIYINSLNQARIFKKCRDLEQAEHYYNRAFFINFQLRNESDLLYTNLCYAQLESLRGSPETALMYWLRTCLHWLSNAMPEALAPRVAQAILGMPLSNQDADVEKISVVLSEQLLVAVKAVGRSVSPLPQAIVLQRIDAASRAEICLAQPGWSVFATGQGERLETIFTGPAYRLLNRQVLGVLAADFPQVDFKLFRTLFTDAQWGIELAEQPRELVWACLKWQVPELLCQGQRYRIDENSLQTFDGFRIESSRAINYVRVGPQQWQVHFKRYLKPLALNKDEQRCMEHLRTPSTFAETGTALGIDAHSCWRLINSMAEKRLVSVL
ncbi:MULTISPECIES: hypothetical protein [unclassified Janthinobacterium]|uniref:hypothetical protein n=1 Tax=unclassified Janthinobacterium TaxID=2610881 RepID=UPI0016174835|nr:MULTISPECIES: hypothetical protein [unclassified Janthinobacterium]MBB5370085.1 tetratricopeptide (TPR) repeat protein [Janthinobacterium sp. K2C7]MBB5382891.1 tetratricopeptide (TPR) repeat protein [Janthinobacterium sp. K2Li3]MBB5384876.1 tetratricopeptide (TPR) repeat protein [Janthinobacterium sp. K2E3]